ncbi:hypothetical protein VN97_g11769 [Penicillium thymicola]|uniref:F-box domain-containing protein n=1 Tax=Penicillium thymicola TaxID=293382 RepID=A0AAI9T7C7_PENTH|nr:hypothetical protein VN97_g11769 [Penicillium thymicola]
MDRAEDKFAPKGPGVSPLGAFTKLPLELRWMIWESVFEQIHSVPFALAIMRCSRRLYQEISGHLFENFEHEFRVADGLRFNFTTKKTSSQGWELWNIDAVRSHLHSFPWEKVGTKMFVNVLPAPEGDPGQIVQIWNKVNQLVDTLKTTPSTPSVWVSLLEDWSNDGKPQESIPYTDGYRPDHDIAIIPFTHLRKRYYRISPAYSAVIATERELPEESQSLLYKGRNGCTSDKWCGIAKRPKHWLVDTRIFLDRKLDDIPGKTAGALRLERFQNWFQDGWESEYENRFTADIQKHVGVVLKHDPSLRGVIRRHYLAIMLHHFYRASHDDPKEVEDALKNKRPRLYSEWDPQVWSDCWGDCMPSLNYSFANAKMDGENQRLVYRSYRRYTVFGLILRGLFF